MKQSINNGPVYASAMALLLRELTREGISVTHQDGHRLRTEGGAYIELVCRPNNKSCLRFDDRVRGLRVNAGYGQGLARSYPLRKDLTFNLDAVIDHVIRCHKALVEADAKRKEAAEKLVADSATGVAVAKELAEITGLRGSRMETWPVRNTYRGEMHKSGLRIAVEPGGGVYLASDRMTLEEAKALLAKLS